MDLEPLRAALDGEIVAPTDPGWDAARQAWNRVADQRPAFVVVARSAQDVVEVVRFARAHGLRIAPQSTGHGAPTLGDLDGTILLRTSGMTAAAVDPTTRTARVQAGALWRDVVAAASEHGLAARHGYSGTVGVAGYTLSGGLGWLARSHGLAANGVLALDVVTADGQARRISALDEPDLFWALRGGGGTHAIVTGLELELVELGEAYGGALMWPIEDAAAVAGAWLAWTRVVPDTVTSSLKLMRFPPLPDLPEPLRGRALVTITLACTDDPAEGEAIVAPLRAVIEPYLDTVTTIPAAALADIAGDPVDPVPGRGDGLLLRELDEAAIDAYVELGGPDAQIPLIQLELRHLGGALAQSSPANGAIDAVEEPYLLFAMGMAMTPELDAAIVATCAQIRERMAPWASPRTLLGFAEQQTGTRASFPPGVADRLAALKATYDPDGLLVANHAID